MTLRRNRRAPHRPRRRGDGAQLSKAYWKIGLALAVMAVVITAAMVFKPTPVNALTGCPKNQNAPGAHTVIIIDETDRLPANELAFVRDLVMTEYMWLPQGGRLTVKTLLADPDKGESIVVCRIAATSKTGGLLDNERLIRRRFDKIAGSRLAILFDELAVAPEQAASPIMEAVAMAFDRTDFLPNVPVRRLVVVSDFAQHSEEYSMYGRGSLAVPDTLEDTFSRDMSGVDVRLQYIRRPDLRGLQREPHREFWTSYFGDQEPKSLNLGHGLLIGEDPHRQTYQYASPGLDTPVER